MSGRSRAELALDENARTWLRRARERKNLTVKQLAAQVGMAESYYTKIELGHRDPSVLLAKRISFVLEVSWTRFFE